MSLKNFDSTLKTHDFVQDLKWDPELRKEFEADESAVLSRQDLTDEERRAIEQRDFRALYEMGVHPYMLAQLARLLFGNAERAGTSSAAQALVESLQGIDEASQ